MAFSPISFIASNYRDYKNNWLKAYEPGTTTPKVMATDSTLNTLIAKAEINKDGFIVSASQALIIPYIDGAYDLWLFPTEADADNNDTILALRVADDVTGANSNPNIEANTERVIPFDTLPLSISETDTLKMFDGAVLNLAGRDTKNDGGAAVWDVVLTSGVTTNGFSIVQCTGILLLATVLRIAKGTVNIQQLGASTSNSDADNDAVLIHANSLGIPIEVNVNINLTGNTNTLGVYYGSGKLNGIPVNKVGQGTSCVFSGFDAAKEFTGDLNTGDLTLIGRGCGRELTTATRSTAIGQGVFSGNTLVTGGPTPYTGNNNFGGGFHALKKMETGTFNVAIGTDTGNEIKTGGSNSLYGASAGQQVTIAFDNTLIGRSAGLRLGLDASSLDPDTYIDLGGGSNVAVGRDAMRNAYDCESNTVIGSQAARGTKDESDFTGNFTGGFNVVVGYRAMYTGPVGAAFNVILGEEAGKEHIDNVNNVIIGAQAGRDANTGDGAIILGALSSRSVTDIDNVFSVANQSGLPFMSGIMGAPGDVGNFLRVDGNLSAQTGSQNTCGTSGRPWTTVFADNNVIQTSDGRLKTTPEEIEEAVFIAWGNARKNIKMWKWLRTGDNGRYHIGPIAQELFKCFTDQGVNPFDYGFACSDLVFESKEVYDGSALVSQEDVPVIDPETGEQLVRFAVRHNELFMLEIAYNVWKEFG